MKGLLLALTVLSLSPGEWQTPPAAPQDGSIAGTVVSAETGRPIGGARLRLIPFDDRALVRSEVVDAQGHYEFRALLPGRYQLSASADRHITLQYGQRDPADASRP
ncbi:MAG: carboxypeptidase regulatory-like domain-containing protein, partial [Acidobacteria bacterium]|nr:carboxypeptidase regulatory-like domain-containing protein [Acidobacteriota bacterium]